MNWSEYPALRISLCFIAGVAIGGLFEISIIALLALVTTIVVTLLILNPRPSTSDSLVILLNLLILVGGFTAGFSRVQMQSADMDAYHYSHYKDSTDKIVMTVLEDVKKKTSLKTTVSVNYINNTPTRGKLLLYLPRQDSLTDIKPGDILVCKGTILATRENSNPYAFDYKAYLKNRGINYQMYLKPQQYKRVKEGRLTWIAKHAYKIRSKSLKILESRLKTDDQIATASAMILGYRDHISEELYNAYSTTGSVHVLAVSGLHVGIVCSLFFMFFKMIKSETIPVKIFKAVVLLSVVWFYAILTGAAPAVIRAAVMFTIMIIGRYALGYQNIYNTLAISAVLLLFYDPLLIYQASFQFSYLALTSIVFFHKIIYNLYESRFVFVDHVWNLGVVALSAQILVFPVTVYYFHKFPLYFIISGIFSVFLAYFILMVGIALLFLSSVPILGDVLAWIFRAILDTFIAIIYFIRDLPYNNISDIWFSFSTTALIYVGILAIMWKIYHKRSTKAVYVMGVVLLGFVWNNTTYRARTATQSSLTIYEVSKGSLLDIFDGNQSWTYKTTGIDDGKEFFAADNHRISGRILNSKELQKSEKYKLNNGVIQYNDKSIYIPVLADNIQSVPMEVDITILCGNINLWPDKLMGYHCTKKIVVDKSIKWGQKEKWKSYALANDIHFHDIRTDGAFILH